MIIPFQTSSPTVGAVGPAGVALSYVSWAGWGIFHAIGAWRFNNNPLRAVVVLACVGAFLGFWMAMLAVRQRRLSK